MTAYPTCTGCALRGKGCERRKAVRHQIAGLKVTSIKFKCDERRPVYERGQLVWARTHDGTDERYDDGSRFFDDFPAVVVGEASGKPLVFIETGAEGEEQGSKFKPVGWGMCKVSLKWLKPREGEPETLCKHCDMPSRLPHREHCICTIGDGLSEAA